ncbi:amino acid ABC transporter permease [Mesorhizobium sp. 8]|jgi:polar amino acid transport system permease protein|uniref:amino acid ABC transporter permease n=1 Tax=Mesorhizobium sp. 8 TaxID=2584466 RepID=UPI0011244CD1|nr:amino acid ABC transporter permease [Mesorhizobium sp. 8]QDC01696.1 amino acid ABC transporter permease [Mesorhizobium sp. 8]
MYQWDFAVVLRSDDLFLQGALATLLLTASALAFAVPLGLVLAMARMSPWAPLRWFAYAIIDFFRTSALFVLIIWFYFAFPLLFNLQVNAFQAATIAIALQGGAYLAEIFRAGIESIQAGQWQAARALGLRFGMTLRLIILPQAIRRVLPVFMNFVVDTIKNTSFAAAIAYGELTYQAMRVSSATFRPLEVFTVIGIIYFVIITLMSWLSGFMERKLAIVER